ncbi:unnamed protein product [Lymnaea stagnalis]|uniref:ubiquitinyl hydrolase 1 n=1 Tax=Lymnaea stagnalis TaxID=6523 RepID=A0AAV2HJ73_LYMST
MISHAFIKSKNLYQFEMDAFNWIYTAIYCIGLDFVAFVLVDVVVKSPLRDAVNEREKRKIWLYESIGLSLICLLLGILHHVPYVLIVLTCVTFMYTQLFGRSDPTNFVANLRAQWENHLQHEESMKQVERQKQQQQQLQQQALGMAGLNHSTAAELSNLSGQNQDLSYGHSYQFFNRQTNLHYPPNATVVPGQERPAYSMGPGSASYRDAVKLSRGLHPAVGKNWNNAGPYAGVDTQNTAVSRGQYDSGITSMQGVDSNERKTLWSNLSLPRRSLHPDLGSKFGPKPMSQSSSIKSKFMNVMGFGQTVPKPVGLVNNGQNMCFINSVIQCLARGPYLVQCLTADAAKELECSVAESDLLSSLAELLDILTIDPVCSDYKVFNATRFRKAASVLNPSLVSPPGEQLRQQDAAEFLMWLLATVHNILNKNRQALECDPSSLTNDDRFSSPRLNSLKLIYGDLNANRIKELKDQCRREIAAANGLENESYAEAIQRLSDLEWLTHKQANETVIDNLFTGQLVEAYHSVEHGHISVNLQAFNVLPVPIAAPRYSSGMVLLEDCFTSFCNVENLSEVPVSPPESVPNTNLQQEPLVQISDVHRRRNVIGKVGVSGTPVSRKPFRLGQGDPSGYLPSPIHQSVFPSPAPASYTIVPVLPANYPLSPPVGVQRLGDSGFLDGNTFKTSTPIGEGVTIRTQPRLQRRCLLRQLPECLIIQLMRFRYDQVAKVSTKVSTSINIRLHGLNLRDVIFDTVTHRSDLTAPSGGYLYQLYGLCLHLGANSIANGHYINYCLDGVKWYRMNDQDVDEVNMEYQLSTEEIRQNAYLLFYRRVNSESESA